MNLNWARTMTVAALLVPTISLAQDETRRAELADEDIAGIIESDSREALEYFLDWVSVPHRVQSDFEAADMNEPPAEMGEWARKALRGLKIQGNRIVIPRLDLAKEVASLYAGAVFQVFYEGPFRDYCLETVSAEITALENELDQQQLEAMSRLEGQPPEAELQILVATRQELFELDMKKAEVEARGKALEERIERRMHEREAQSAVPETVQGFEEVVNGLRAELDRLVRQKEKLGTRETRDIEEMENRLREAEIERARMMDEWNARRNAGQEDLGHLRDMLIEAETDFVGLESRSQALKGRVEELTRRAEAAREIMERRMSLEARGNELKRVYDRIHSGRLFGLRGIPQMRFR